MPSVGESALIPRDFLLSPGERLKSGDVYSVAVSSAHGGRVEVFPTGNVNVCILGSIMQVILLLGKTLGN